MIQLSASAADKPVDGANLAAPKAPPSHVTPRASAAAELLAIELRRSLGQSPQLDKALGQLLSLMA